MALTQNSTTPPGTWRLRPRDLDSFQVIARNRLFFRGAAFPFEFRSRRWASRPRAETPVDDTAVYTSLPVGRFSNQIRSFSSQLYEAGGIRPSLPLGYRLGCPAAARCAAALDIFWARNLLPPRHGPTNDAAHRAPHCPGLCPKTVRRGFHMGTDVFEHSQIDANRPYRFTPYPFGDGPLVVVLFPAFPNAGIRGAINARHRGSWGFRAVAADSGAMAATTTGRPTGDYQPQLTCWPTSSLQSPRSVSHSQFVVGHELGIRRSPV